MKYGLKLSNSIVAKTVALALVAVLSVSFIGSTHADIFYNLTINVNDACGPVDAQAVIVNGPDDGASASGSQIGFNLRAGVFYVHLSAVGHNPVDTNTIVLNSNQTINVSMDRTASGCGGGDTFVDLNFIVKDNCNNNRIAGASVNIDQDFGNGQNRSTDGSGFANFGVLNGRNLAWSVSASGYSSASGGTNSGSSETTVEVGLNRSCGTTPTPTPTPVNFYNLTINVNDICGPVAAQAVIVNGPDDGAFGITTNGSFTFTLRAGVFYVHLSAAGHNPVDTNTIVLNSNQSITVTMTRTTGGCGGNIFVDLNYLVKDVCNNNSIAGTAVRIDQDFGNGQNRSTDGSGFANFRVLQNRNIGWTVSASGYSSASGSTNSGSNGDTVNVILNRTCTTPTAQLTLIKEVDNTGGGTASPPDFELRVNGQTIRSGQTVTLSPGDYIVSENQRSDYRLVGIRGACAGGGTITLSSGDNKTCVVSNAFIPPQNNPPTGSLDQADCTSIAGWASDSDTPNTPVTVHIYIDGPAGNGGTFVTAVVANQFRSDVGNHGFQIPTPAVFKTGGSHTVFVYALDSSGNGTNPLLNSAPKTITCVTTQLGTISVVKNARNVTVGTTAFINSIPANPGDQVEFRITVTANNGPVDNVSLTDTLPSRLAYVTNSLTIDGAPSGNNLNNLALGNLVSGQTKTIIIRATVANASQFGNGTTTLTNLAQGTSSTNTANASANVNVNVSIVVLSGSVSLAKSVRNVSAGQTTFVKTTTASPGDTVQFQLVVTASGSTAAQGVNVLDTLPSNMTLSSGSTGVSVGTLNPGASQTINLSAVIANENSFTCNSTMTLVNNAQATALETSAANDTATVNVFRNCNLTSSLTLVKTARNVTQNQTAFLKSITANPGDQVQFQIQVTANGTAAAQNVQVTDTLPNNFILSSGSTTFTLGTINPGSNQSVNLSATVNSSGFPTGTSEWTNFAQATSTNAGTTSDTAKINVTIAAPTNANLTLSKEVRNLNSNPAFTNFVNASNNDRIEFRLRVTNTSSNPTANNVRVSDILPNGLTYIPGTFLVDSGASFGSLFGGNQFLGNLSPGQSRVITFQTTVNTSGNQTLINKTTALADNSNTANASATVYVSAVLGGNIDLVLSKRAFNQTQNVDATAVVARSGNLIIYTLSVRNQGSAAATNFVFQDDLSDVLQLSQLQSFGDATFNLAPLTLTWPQTTVAAGANVEKTFTVKVNATFPAGSDNVMTNVFGNTINVRVTKPAVSGAFVAPKTGSTTTIAFILALLTVFSLVGFKYVKKLKKFSWQTIRQRP